MDKNKIIRLITSLAISIALWVYVINVVNPTSSTVVKNVPVSLTGTDVLYENNLAIQGDGEYTVDVVVSAPRTELGSLSADNFIATADVSELTLGQDYITISVQAPTGYTVSEIRSRKIQVYVDELVKQTVPVQFEYSSVGDNMETTIVSANPLTIEVFGAKSLMENFGSYIVSIDNSQLKNEEVLQFELSGEARDKSGNKLKGITASSQTIKVWATIYSTKTVNLNVSYGGDVWQGVSLTKVTVPKTINIKGPVDSLAEISELNTEYIDLSGIYKDTTENITPYLPENIYICDDCKDYSLTANVSEDANISFDFYAWEVVIRNATDETKNGFVEIADGDCITVSVQGDATVLKTMSKADISVYVDGKSWSKTNNTLKVMTNTNIEDVVMTVSPSQVNLVVN